MFDSLGTFNVVLGTDSIEYLIVAGGGGCTNQAGGGAGGVLRNNALNYKVIAGDTFHVKVGEGGVVGANGKNSSFGTITAIGGGTARASGGSGGGGFPISGQQPPGKGIVGQGNDGGSGYWYTRAMTSGGGAGAAGVYQNAGAGILSSITGVATYYAGGGGGYKAGYGPTKTPPSPGKGGTGGGGDYGKSGLANTGGGAGGTGGSGVVILRYRSYVCLVGTITPDTAICPESSITLQAGGGLYYKWMKGTDTTSIGNASSLTVSPFDNANYTVKISNDSCYITKTVSVSIKDFSGIKVSGKTVVCTGDSSQLSVTGGVAYLWNTGAITKSINVSPLADFIYSVTVSNGCSDTLIKVPVTMFSSSSVNITGDSVACKGEGITLTASGGPDYKWTTGATTESVNVISIQDTIYKVVVTNGKCIDSTTFSVRVAPVPTSNAGTDIMACGDNNLVQLNGSGFGGSAPLSFKWTPANLLNDSALANPLASLVDTTTSFILNVSDGICASTDTVLVTISTINATFSGDTAICNGDSAALSINGGVGASYQWSTGDTLSKIELKPSQGTIFSVAISNNGTCKASTFIYVGAYPVINASNDTTICAGVSVSLSVSGGTSSSIYHWMGINLNDTSINSPIARPLDTAMYIASVTDGICSTDDTVFVNVNPLPKVIVTPQKKELRLGESNSLLASGADMYLWIPSVGLNNTTGATVIANPSEGITYNVVGTDSHGCVNTDSVVISFLNQSCVPYVPTAFSPNSDGQNDVLKAHSNCVTEFNLSIYDRWGEKVFETSDINKGWDGNYKGEPMNAGVFVYYLTATSLIDGMPITEKGNISLIR